MVKNKPRKGENIMAINDVSLTSGMRANLLSLQNTVSLLDRTQQRLSTGKKVNTAMDNPVSYFAAQALNSRASIIDGLKDAMGQAVQTITSADKGITALSTMIEQAKGIAQSAQSATAATSETENVSTIATYQTITLSMGAAATLTAGDKVTIGGSTFVYTASGAVATAGQWTSVAELEALIVALTTGTYTATGASTITITKATTSLTIGDITTAFTNAETVAVGAAEERTFTVGGTAFTYTAGVSTGYTTTSVGSAGNSVVATLLAASITGANIGSSTLSGTTLTVSVASSELKSLEAQYNALRFQMDELAEDAGYKGKNLLSSDNLVVKFEGVSLTVSGFDASTTGLGITAATWVIGGSIDGDLTSLDTSLVTLRERSSTLSGNLSIITVRQDFSTNMINTLNAGADKLTLADTNEEGANMLMLQTRQSLSTTALSLSAQAAQSVLKLFG